MDPYDLNRFVVAHEGVFETVRRELAQGRKESHWMWFIFPQIEGLGSSSMARYYAIKSRDEAKAYLEHPVLRERLTLCARALLKLEGKSAAQVMSFPDELKLRSSMTLFGTVAGGDNVFRRVIDKYFQGKMDQRTLDLL